MNMIRAIAKSKKNENQKNGNIWKWYKLNNKTGSETSSQKSRSQVPSELIVQNSSEFQENKSNQ